MYSKTLDIDWWLQKDKQAPMSTFAPIWCCAIRPDFDATTKQDQAATASFGSH